jgi:hypothetical protein
MGYVGRGVPPSVLPNLRRPRVKQSGYKLASREGRLQRNGLA